MTLLGEHHHVLLSIVLVLNEMVLVLVLDAAIRIEYEYRRWLSTSTKNQGLRSKTRIEWWRSARRVDVISFNRVGIAPRIQCSSLDGLAVR